jgi:hypothetical protein
MPAAVDAPIRHDFDSEEDLDYVPEGEERGVIHTPARFKGIYKVPHSDSDTDNERDTKRPRVENPPLAPEDLATAKRCAHIFCVRELTLKKAVANDRCYGPNSKTPSIRRRPRRRRAGPSGWLKSRSDTGSRGRTLCECSRICFPDCLPD